MKQQNEARRAFLKKLGLTGVSLSLLNDSLFAEEIVDTPIKRLLLIEHPDGINPQHWYPTGTETDFTLPAMTEPFNIVKDECVFLEGINLGGNLAGHGAYMGLWRGDTKRSSIDQHFAEKWRGQTVIPSLVHKASDIYNGSRSLAYDALGKSMPALTNPLSLLDKIYTSSDIEASQLSALAEQQRRLQSIRTDLEAFMQGELSDNVVLQAHKKGVDDVLTALTQSGGQTTTVNMESWKEAFEAKATAGGLTSRNENRYQNGILASNTAFTLMSDLHEDAIVTALKYDRTRVINYSYGCDTWDFYMNCDDGGSYPYHNAGHDMSQGHIETRKMTSKRVANLIKTLKETDDIYGNPLLDSTLVVYACEIGHASNHTNQNAPFILAGAGVEGGRYLNYNGVLWNKVLVSIANILGDDLTTFGSTDPEGGALEGLV
ncbi:DUF1552 domain-containing protein [bacterium]|nr:DUF1552 domain-containing protein [bacterium]MBU1957430.1 DUF1552 domain-containing protein [bacterium]